MKLGSKVLKISAVFPPLLAILVGVSLFVRSRQEDDLSRRLWIAELIADEVTEVGHATQEYLRRADADAEEEWRLRYAFLRRNGIARLEATLNGPEQTMVESVRVNYESMGSTFDSIVEYFSALKKSGGQDRSESAVAGMVQDLNERSKAVVASAFRLAQINHARAAASRQVADSSIITVSAIVALLMACGVYAVAHEEMSERRKIDQALRKSDVQLSDAFLKLRRAGDQVARSERMHTIEQAAHDVIHEWRNAVTPLSASAAYLVEAVKALNDGGEAAEILKVVQNSVKRADAEIDRLSEILSPQIGKGKTVNINDIVESALRSTERMWLDRPDWQHIEVQKDLGEIPPVYGSVSDLTDALTHVVANAVEAMNRGGTLSIKTDRVGMWVNVRISDNGVGMSSDVLARCFESFFSTKGYGSAGMGLTLAQGIVHQHHGTIEIDSSCGKGTTVAISLPVELSPQAGNVSSSGSVGTRYTFGLKKLRILVIDDEPWSLNLIVTGLKSDGHFVDTAGSGGEGIEKFNANDYDLLLTDRAMPDMSGMELAAQVKKAAPDMPIIMITGYGDSASNQTGPRFADKVLGKPFSIEELRAAIGEVMRNKEGHA